MDDFEFDMDPWIPALGVWLHDHGLLVAVDFGSTSTDYGFGADEVEYSLSPELLQLVISATPVVGYSDGVDSFKFGWTKSYKPYLPGCELVAVFAQTVPGGLRLKLHVKQAKPAGESEKSWTEFLTYHGAYTVLWSMESGHA